MKAWEIVKHLESGGSAKYLGNETTLPSREEVVIENMDKYIDTITFDPDNWLLNKPTKTITMYRYTFLGYDHEYYQTKWTTMGGKYFTLDNKTLVKTETKEVEIEIDQDLAKFERE